MSSDFDRLFLESKQGEPVMMGNGTVIGCVVNRKYIKRVHKEHIMKIPPAIAIDKDVFARYIQPKCDYIFVLNMDTGEFYSSSVPNFAQHSFYLDRGYYGQLALAMEHWGKNTGVVNQVKMPL